MQPHPVAGQPRVVFLRPLIRSHSIEIGEYTYYDDPERPEQFEDKAVLYAFGPEKLIIGRFCALASGVRFLMPGGNHADLGPSTFPFGIFGEPWASTTMDLVLAGTSKGDTRVGSDVWIGNNATVLPGVTIGSGAVVAASSVVANDVPAYAVSLAIPRVSSGCASTTPTCNGCCAQRGGTGQSSSSPSMSGRSWPAHRRSLTRSAHARCALPRDRPLPVVLSACGTRLQRILSARGDPSRPTRRACTVTPST